MASADDVRKTLYEAIQKAAAGEERPAQLLQLAEAFAWAYYPNQSHGGASTEKS